MRLRVAIVCALLACGLGLFLRYETTVHEITGAASSCTINQEFDCDAVQNSVYAKLFGVSVSLWAAAGSAALAGMLLLIPKFGGGMLKLAGLLSLANGLTSLAYLFISIFVLGINCLYCNGIQGLSVIGAALVVPVAWTAQGPWFDRRAAGAATIVGMLALFFAVLGDTYANARAELGRTREAQPSTALRVEVSDAMVLGDPDRGSEFSYVIYFDFGCPRCLACYDKAKEIQAKNPDRVHYFFKHWPLDKSCNQRLYQTNHPRACLAAKAGIAASLKGKSREALGELFALKKKGFTMRGLDDVGRNIGVDASEWTKLRRSTLATDVLQRDIAEGNTLEFRAVPGVFLNGRSMRDMRLPRR